MLTDAIRLFLFPALMVFAASTDLLTMTISNKLSLALTGGFFLLAIVTGMSLAAVGIHLGAAALVLVIAFGFFVRGWIGGRHRTLVRLRLSAGLSPHCRVVWRGADAASDFVSPAAAPGRAGPAKLDSPLAQRRQRRALRHRARCRSTTRLPQNRLDARGRPVNFRARAHDRGVVRKRNFGAI
jgi:hypothetical protein